MAVPDEGHPAHPLLERYYGELTASHVEKKTVSVNSCRCFKSSNHVVLSCSISLEFEYVKCLGFFVSGLVRSQGNLSYL